MEKVSVIIPTFNRFRYLLNTINSVKNQTYKNLEIIVINDRSTQKEYYRYDWKKAGVIILHLDKNSKEMFGFGCAAHVRNKGIEIATGDYIAFCDDDDIWFPNKIELQLNAMKNTNCEMSSTDGLFGMGVYNPKQHYLKFNAEQHYNFIANTYLAKNSNLFSDGFPQIWTLEFLKINNCMICSSVIVKKTILTKINGMRYIKDGEDYDCWLRALEHTNSVYVPEVCFYYDAKHGDGQNWR